MISDGTTRRVWLIGLPCSGKSTLGHALAAYSSYVTFVDLDEAIEREAGCTVSEIFSRNGEAHFRALERNMLERLASTPVPEGHTLVIATGGGTPCRPGAIELMHASGTSVLLEATRERLLSRLADGRDKRPLIARLDDEALEQYIDALSAERAPWYGRAAERFDSSYLDTPDELASSVTRFAERFLMSATDINK